MNKIYRIVNSLTNRTYIGFTSGELNHRLKQHVWNLRANKHTSKQMQFDFNEYGEDLFYIELVENVYNKEDSKELEDYWMTIKDDEFHANYNRKENGKFMKSNVPKLGCWNI